MTAQQRLESIAKDFAGHYSDLWTSRKTMFVCLSEQIDVKSLIYETTTNGTLVHGEIKEWLYQHKDQFFIALSLDGTKEMHDINGRTVNDTGSFDNIDIDFFTKTWPGCALQR